MLIVEHNMDLVMSLSHKVVVMAHGQVIAEGAPGRRAGRTRWCWRPISAAPRERPRAQRRGVGHA